MKITLDDCFILVAAFTALDRGHPSEKDPRVLVPFELTGGDRYNLGRNFQRANAEVVEFQRNTAPGYIKEIYGQEEKPEPLAATATDSEKVARAELDSKLQTKLNDAGKTEIEVDIRPFKDRLSLDKNQIPATTILAAFDKLNLLPEPPAAPAKT